MQNAVFDMARTGIAISLVDLMIGLALAMVLGVVIVFVYRLTHRGFHYERSFLVTLVATPGIIAVVMMLIGSNLALSLGMVGALSIIRFRTVIKDSRDMVFLFLAIAVGLGCGTYNWTVIIVATLLLALLLLVLHMVQFGRPMHADYVLVLSGRGRQPDAGLRAALKQRVDYLEVRSINISDEAWEIVFEVRFFKERAPAEASLFDDLKQAYGVERISFLAPQLSLPM